MRLRELRLERALADGDLPARADAGALARYIVAVMRGMAVEAASSGAKGRELHQIVDLTMRAWPADLTQGGERDRPLDG